MLNLSNESIIVLEVRRLFGAGRSLVKANSKVITELKNACFSHDYNTARIVQLAHTDGAVLSKIIEIANRSVRYKRKTPITDPAQCVARIGQKCMQGVSLNLEIESLSIKLNDFWKKVFKKIESNTRKALLEAMNLNNENESSNLFEITNKTLLLSLSCYAKAVACSNTDIKMTKELLRFVLTPEPVMAELIQTSMGVRVEILSFSEDDVSKSSYIAAAAWTKVSGDTTHNLVNNLEFSP